MKWEWRKNAMRDLMILMLDGQSVLLTYDILVHCSGSVHA
jgi:hypothetical protein